MEKINKNSSTESFSKVSINWYPGHMAKTKRLIKEKIDLIDIVYEVIDARIPHSSKITDIDDYIKNKPRILIFSKMDLCDYNETKKWMQYYKEKGYVVVGVDLTNPGSVKQIIDETMQLLENEKKKREQKGMKERKARVLVVGIPNAGKSTLINRLVGKKAVVVGNKPGVTKNLDWIRINDSLELLDSPGILWPKFESNRVAFNLASLTAIKEEILPLDEVVIYILEMLEKYYPKILKQRYGIDQLHEDIVETLEYIGKKRGCLIRGGEVDYDKVYSVVLSDIKDGSIKGITFDRMEHENE